MTMTAAAPQLYLTPDDLKTIKQILPRHWRIQVSEATGLTTRQVGEVFYLRTTNAKQNKLVWEMIKKILVMLNQDELEGLVAKIERRLITTNMGR